MEQMNHERYSHSDIHRLLTERWPQRVPSHDEHGETDHQALFCPYYVPLEGVLGMDWGVVVNPRSPRFGDLVFEHDGCGCLDGSHAVSSDWETDSWQRSGAATD
jgi:hypothetical protein